MIIIYISFFLQLDPISSNLSVSGNSSSVVTINGNAGLGEYQSLLRALLYRNDASEPNNSFPRGLSLELFDSINAPLPLDLVISIQIVDDR